MADIASLLAQGSKARPVTSAVSGERARLQNLLTQSEANLYNALAPAKQQSAQLGNVFLGNQITKQEQDIINNMNDQQREQARGITNKAARFATMWKSQGGSPQDFLKGLSFIQGFDTAGVAQAIGNGADPSYIADSLIAESDEFNKLFPMTQKGVETKNLPMSIQEWKIFQKMSPQDQEKYLTMKRANPQFKIGDVPMRGSQLDATGRAYTEQGLPSTQQGIQGLVTEQKGAQAQVTSQKKKEGEKIALYTDQADTWDVNRDYIVNNILADLAPNDPNVKSLLANTPGSSVSKAVQGALSMAIGNTKGADAQAILEQYGAIMLQGIPFPPGQQSDKEMQQRAKVVSDQVANPNITPSAKIKILGNFVEWQDTRAKNFRMKANKLQGIKPTRQQSGPPPGYQLMEDANGNRAYVGPNGEIQEVR